MALALISATMPCGLAQQAPSREVPSEEEIAAKVRANIAPTTGEVKPVPQPAQQEKEKGLYERFDVLAFGGMATIVPKGSILKTPPAFVSRVLSKRDPGTKMVQWKEFLAANRGWLRTFEVTQAQAQGREPFNEETAKNLASSSSLTVAIFQGNPINILPPRPSATPPPTPAKP